MGMISLTCSKVKGCLYRAQPRPRTRPLKLSARLSAWKFARTTFPTERGNSGCDSRDLCCHAPSHENGSKSLRHRFWWHFGILPLHTDEEKEEGIQAYIYTPDFTEASYLWRTPPPSKGASFPPRQVSLLLQNDKGTVWLRAGTDRRWYWKQGKTPTGARHLHQDSDLLSVWGEVQYRVSPGPSYMKTKELIGWQEIVRATIA